MGKKSSRGAGGGGGGAAAGGAEEEGNENHHKHMLTVYPIITLFDRIDDRSEAFFDCTLGRVYDQIDI